MQKASSAVAVLGEDPFLPARAPALSGPRLRQFRRVWEREPAMVQRPSSPLSEAAKPGQLVAAPHACSASLLGTNSLATGWRRMKEIRAQAHDVGLASD